MSKEEVSPPQTRVFDTPEEVQAFHQEDPDNRIVVIYQGVVYDVKDYFHEHPGGSDLIQEQLGQEIDDKFEEAEHTTTARKIFSHFPVLGTVKQAKGSKVRKASLGAGPAEESAASEGEVMGLDGFCLDKGLAKRLDLDYSKGIIWQLLTKSISLEEYRQFVNEPKNFVGQESKHVKMFDSWFFEVNSKTPWYYVPLAYIPVSCYLFYMIEAAPLDALFIWALGAITWTLTEYCLHRFVFHGEDVVMPYLPESNVMYMLHFCLHGIHHAFPEDSLRLVFPPLLGHILFYYSFLIPITSALPTWFAYAFMLGLLQGYQTYDCFHYFLHHSSPAEGTYTKEMKVYHMQHHYKYGVTGFGVSNKFWDFMFGTEIRQNAKAPVSYFEEKKKE